MEEITKVEDIQEMKNEEIITEEKDKKELSEREKRYQEIQEKKANKKRLSVEERIFLKEMELTDLKIILQEQQKKERTVWMKSIYKVLKPELEKIYDKEAQDLDIKIASLLINSLENFEELSKNINAEEYLTRNKSNKMIRIKKEM